MEWSTFGAFIAGVVATLVGVSTIGSHRAQNRERVEKAALDERDRAKKARADRQAMFDRAIAGIRSSVSSLAVESLDGQHAWSGLDALRIYRRGLESLPPMLGHPAINAELVQFIQPSTRQAICDAARAVIAAFDAANASHHLREDEKAAFSSAGRAAIGEDLAAVLCTLAVSAPTYGVAKEVVNAFPFFAFDWSIAAWGEKVESRVKAAVV